MTNGGSRKKAPARSKTTRAPSKAPTLHWTQLSKSNKVSLASTKMSATGCSADYKNGNRSSSNEQSSTSSSKWGTAAHTAAELSRSCPTMAVSTESSTRTHSASTRFTSKPNVTRLTTLCNAPPSKALLAHSAARQTVD